jgi:predicted restriction endonuclease
MVEARDKRRAFTITQKNDILHQQDYKCAICHRKLDIRIVEYDHVKAWSASGKTTIKNGAALCPICHRLKTHKSLVKKIDNSKMQRKLASKEHLNKLTVRQLKYLTKKHGITPSATIMRYWDGTSKVTTSKRQYVNSLFGEVYEGEKLPD